MQQEQPEATVRLLNGPNAGKVLVVQPDKIEKARASQVVKKRGDYVFPEIRMLKGQPTDAELAAVVTVLAGLHGAPATPGPQELNLWGHPVDKLRYPPYSWQAVTVRDRMHVRR